MLSVVCIHMISEKRRIASRANMSDFTGASASSQSDRVALPDEPFKYAVDTCAHSIHALGVLCIVCMCVVTSLVPPPSSLSVLCIYPS
jgi:hypothetical protein